MTSTAKKTAKLAADLATAMRQLWRSEDTVVQRMLAPLAMQYPRGDGFPVTAIILASKPPPSEDHLPMIIGDPGFIVSLEEMRRAAELIAATLPVDRGGRRRSVPFKKFALSLAGIYTEITGEPAQTSTRAGASDGRFLRFTAAVIAWLKAAARELPDVTLDLPPSDDALRMTLHRLKQANKNSSPK